MFDHTDAGTVYTKAQMLNGSSGAQVGLAKILSAFNLSAPLAGETGTARAALQEYGTFIAGNGNPGNEDSPKGWLNILVFDRDHNLIDLAFEQLSSDYVQEVGSLIKAPHQLLSKEVTIKEPSYVYIYVSNEGSIAQEIYFDDFMISHKKSQVIQSDDYYPFGLTFNSFQRESSSYNSYQYNGKEKQDELGLYWLDYGARLYMSEIGRWSVVDPSSDEEEQESESPYGYVANNPVSHNDPDGKIWGNIVGAVVGAAVEVGSQLITDGEVTSWTKVGISAVEGGITSGGSVIRKVVAKTALALASSAVDYVNDGGKIEGVKDVVNIAKNAAIDKVVDKVSGGLASKTGGKIMKQAIASKADKVLTVSKAAVKDGLAGSNLSGKTKNAAAEFVNGQSKELATEAKKLIATVQSTGQKAVVDSKKKDAMNNTNL